MNDIPFPDNVTPLRVITREPLKTFYASHIVEIPPPPEWIWDGLALRGTVILLSGDAKVGKSLLAQQMLSCGALGLDCLGRAMTKVKTFGWFCEDSEDWLRRRQLWINSHLDVMPPDYELNFQMESRVARDCVLAEFGRNGQMVPTDNWRPFWQNIIDEGSELIVIDTAAAVFGGNENDRVQVTQFMRALNRKAVELNACVVLLAHPPKANPRGFSGTGAWLASARGGLNMHRPDHDQNPDENVRFLEGMGANYAARMPPIQLRWENQVFIPQDPDPTINLVNTWDKYELDFRLLAGLKRALLNGAKIPADELAIGSLPCRARKVPDMSKISLNALYDAQHRMLERGQIVRVKVGGKCLIRPHDGPKYENEETWRVR